MRDGIAFESEEQQRLRLSLSYMTDEETNSV
jgi:hypothetical protein